MDTPENNTPPSSSRTILRLIGALIVVAVIVAYLLYMSSKGSGYPPPEAGATSTDQIGTTAGSVISASSTTYTHPSSRYSVTLPEGWVATELPLDAQFPQTISTTFAPSNSIPSDRVFSFDIIVSPTSESNQRYLTAHGRVPTPQDLFDAHITQLKTDLAGFELVSTTTQIIHGKPALVFTARWADDQITARKYLFFTPEKIYSIGMTSLSGVWDTNILTLAGITESFRVQ